MSLLTAHADGLWTADAPVRLFGLFEIGTRMTVVRLSSGELWVHSPISPSTVRGELDLLGAVRHIVAPNLYHHLFAGPFRDAYRQAKLWGAPGLAKKRRDLRFDAELGAEPPAEWAADLDQLPIVSMLGEVVFLHRRSRTVISSDLVARTSGEGSVLTRLYASLGGFRKEHAVPRALRLGYRDRAAARRSIERLLAWDFDRLIIAHGPVIESGGKEVVRRAFGWLLR
jgi:hypothetical protein